MPNPIPRVSPIFFSTHSRKAVPLGAPKNKEVTATLRFASSTTFNARVPSELQQPHAAQMALARTACRFQTASTPSACNMSKAVLNP